MSVLCLNVYRLYVANIVSIGLCFKKLHLVKVGMCLRETVSEFALFSVSGLKDEQLIFKKTNLHEN